MAGTESASPTTKLALPPAGLTQTSAALNSENQRPLVTHSLAKDVPPPTSRTTKGFSSATTRAATSALPPVIIGLVGALLSLAFVLAAYVLHRKSRMTKLASAAQAQQTTMMGNLGGAIPVAPPATFSFAGAAGNPLAKQQLAKAMSAGRGSMSVRTVRVPKEASPAGDE